MRLIPGFIMIKYENGIHDISNNEYHSSAGISRSMLMDFKRSPYHYWYKHLSGHYEREDATPAMNLGSAVHTLVLEEHKFDSEFFVIKTDTKPRKDSKAYQMLLTEAEGKIILSRDEYIHAGKMALSVKNDVDARTLLNSCKIEQSIYFTHKVTGMQCKVRPDAWCKGLVMDLKTSGDASYKAFQSSAMNYGYFIQAGMMQEALQSVGESLECFTDLVVEKHAPFPLAIYMMTEDALDYGIKQFDNLITGLAKCLEKDKWPSYGIRELEVPNWVKYENELEIE